MLYPIESRIFTDKALCRSILFYFQEPESTARFPLEATSFEALYIMCPQKIPAQNETLSWANY